MITDRNAVVVWPDYNFRVNSTTFQTSKRQDKQVLRTSSGLYVYFNISLNIAPTGNRGIVADSSILYNGNNGLTTDVMTNMLCLSQGNSGTSARIADGDL